LPTGPDRSDFRTIRKMVQDRLEKALPIDRSSQVAHAPRKDGIEVLEKLLASPLHSKPQLTCLANLITNLGVESVPQFFRAGRKFQAHVHFAPIGLDKQRMCERFILAKLQKSDLKDMRECSGRLHEGRGSLG